MPQEEAGGDEDTPQRRRRGRPRTIRHEVGLGKSLKKTKGQALEKKKAQGRDKKRGGMEVVCHFYW